MARDNDNHSSNDDELSPGISTNPHGSKERREPTFSHYNEDEEYEEADRDADHTSGYRMDDAAQEDDFEEAYPEEEPDLFRDEEADREYDAGLPDEDNADDWAEKEGYFEEDEDQQQNWPLSLIAVAIVALILLAAGGYGVMQQRTETENELRELRAALATTANPSDLSASRDALEQQQLAVDTLAAEAEALRLENRALSDTVTGLQAQLNNLRTAPTTADAIVGQGEPTAEDSATPEAVIPEPAQPVRTLSAAPPPIPGPEPEPEPEPEPKLTEPEVPTPEQPEPAGSASTGPWFVNFGSYATRNVAESWAARLNPGAGEVMIIPNSSSGRTLYRLRVIGLSDADSAKQVARKLETDLQVSKLWVGKE